MKKLLLLFAALLIAGCGERKESVTTGGGEKAEDSVITGGGEKAEDSVITGGGEKAEDSVITGGGEKAEDSVITGKWTDESSPDSVTIEFFEDGTYKAWGVREKGTYQILDGNRLQMKEGPHSTFIENLQISETELTGTNIVGDIRWLRK